MRGRVAWGNNLSVSIENDPSSTGEKPVFTLRVLYRPAGSSTLESRVNATSPFVRGVV